MIETLVIFACMMSILFFLDRIIDCILGDL